MNPCGPNLGLLRITSMYGFSFIHAHDSAATEDPPECHRMQYGAAAAVLRAGLMVCIRHDFNLSRLVYPEVVNIRFGVLLVGVLAMSALAQTEQALQKLLPPDARIIEVANLAVAGHRPRALVLWMRNPKRVVRQGSMYCGDYVYGDYWTGPTRLSLIDSALPKLINLARDTPSSRAWVLP